MILDDEEKFKDNEGNIVEIETRGERTPTDVYFLGSDVAIAFEMKKLLDYLIHTNSNYLLNEHYMYFICERPQIVGHMLA